MQANGHAVLPGVNRSEYLTCQGLEVDETAVRMVYNIPQFGAAQSFYFLPRTLVFNIIACV